MIETLQTDFILILVIVFGIVFGSLISLLIMTSKGWFDNEKLLKPQKRSLLDVMLSDDHLQFIENSKELSATELLKRYKKND